MVLGLLLFLTVGSFVSGISIHRSSTVSMIPINIARRQEANEEEDPTSNDDSGKPDDSGSGKPDDSGRRQAR